MPATSSIISDPAAKSSTDTVAQDDPDAPGAPISVPDSGDHEGGKLKMIIQLVKRSLGVKDLAAMRISLPASLMEPVPNLEYWGYLDRPDLFAAINEHEDPLERMLSVLRFTFSKDLKFIKGKVCKPYNSVLGEHFRAYYDVPINAITFKSKDSGSLRNSVGIWTIAISLIRISRPSRHQPSVSSRPRVRVLASRVSRLRICSVITIMPRARQTCLSDQHLVPNLAMLHLLLMEMTLRTPNHRVTLVFFS